MVQPSAEGNFCDNINRPMKPQGLRRQFWLYVQQLFDESMYLQVEHEIVFPLSGSNSTQQLDPVYLNVGVNIPTKISGSFWWGIWLKKLENAKIPPSPGWLEDQVQP